MIPDEAVARWCHATQSRRRAVGRELAGLEIEIETGEDVLVREQRIAS